MVQANVITSVVLKILFPCESLSLQITAKVSKITKSVQRDPKFIFNELSETAYGFVKTSVVLEIKKTTSFMKSHFY